VLREAPDTTGPERFSKRRLVVVTLIAVVLAVEVWLHWNWLPYLSNSRLLSLGGVAEIAIWLLLASVLIAVQTQRLPERIYWLLSVGLGIWLVSQTADLIDEFLRQPLWISIYGEDSGRVIGMFLVTLGLISLIRHSAAMLLDLEFLSFHDSLTGLCNRRMFQKSIAARDQEIFGLMLMDLDHFKNINDKFGHDIGDKVLRGIAGLLQRHCGDHGEIFRLGGEEFAVVMANASKAELEQCAESFRKRVASLNDDGETRVTISIGTGLRRRGESSSELMRRVDRALYRAKDEGRNCVMSSE
jgi:diguanylate cyclase (GGDEF)-like protein